MTSVVISAIVVKSGLAIKAGSLLISFAVSGRSAPSNLATAVEINAVVPTIAETFSTANHQSADHLAKVAPPIVSTLTIPMMNSRLIKKNVKTPTVTAKSNPTKSSFTTIFLYSPLSYSLSASERITIAAPCEPAFPALSKRRKNRHNNNLAISASNEFMISEVKTLKTISERSQGAALLNRETTFVSR